MRDVSLVRRGLARRILAGAGLASLAAGLLLLPAASRSAAGVIRAGAPRARGLSPAAAGGGPVTVTGPRMYNPQPPHTPLPPSTVTVSQTTGLTDQLVHVSWTNFTPSNLQGGSPYYQKDLTDYAVMAVECPGTNPASYTSCYESNTGGDPQPSGPSGPPNAAYAITIPEGTPGQGTGQLNFYVETSLENSILGCDQNHPCSLVVVPGQGGTPSGTGGNPNCAGHSGDLSVGFAHGSETFIGPPVNSAGLLACSWAQRVVIPLQFAPVPTGCPQRAAAFSVEGSPMMAPAMQQWLTGLCAGSTGITIAYNSTNTEPTAVQDAANGAADVALTTRPASATGVTPAKSVVYAPIAISAVSIAFWLDDTATGQPVTSLDLNQRLLAKLLTNSYDPQGIGCPPGVTTGCDPGVSATNPPTMMGQLAAGIGIPGDPEFQSLSTTDGSLYEKVGGNQTFLVPTVQSGPSDMTWTLTRWIGADANATAFLNGTAAPGGMTVNTDYKGLQLPTDTFTPKDSVVPYTNLYSPVFPLSQAVTYQALNQDAGSNIPAIPPATGYTKDPPQPAGNRSLIAIVDEGDAALDHFPVAAIPNASGNYVTPSSTTMAAAVSHMISDGSGTLQVNLADKTPTAYPLTMVIYAMAPTSGLPKAKAAAIARFLDFAAGAGQTTGTGPGQLPAGYLPLPASMRAQTVKLAAAVAKQAGSTGGGSAGSGSGSAGSGAGAGSGGTPTSAARGGTGHSGTSASRTPVAGHPISLVATHVKPASITRYALPALLIVGALAALGGSSALAGSSEEDIRTRLRRLGQAVRDQPKSLLRWRKT